MTKLYDVRSIVDDFRGFDGVELWWVALRRDEPIGPYGELIGGYDQANKDERANSENALDELFTHDEAEALREYLRTRYRIEVQIEKVALPIPSNTTGASAVSPIGGNGFWREWEAEGYSLPFSAGAGYDVRKCRLSDSGFATLVAPTVAYLREALRDLGVELAGQRQLTDVAKRLCVDSRMLVRELSEDEIWDEIDERVPASRPVGEGRHLMRYGLPFERDRGVLNR